MYNQRRPCGSAPFKSGGLGLQNNAVQRGGLQGVLQNDTSNQLNLAGLDGPGSGHVRHIAGNHAVAGGGNSVETVQANADSVNAGSTGGAGGGSGSTNNIHRSGAIVILTHVQQRDTGEGLHELAEVVLGPLVITGAAGGSTNFQQHVAIHHQHSHIAIHGMNQLIQLVNKSVAVAVQIGSAGQIDVGSKLVGASVQQLTQAIKGVDYVTGTRGCGNTVNNGIVESISSRLDLLSGLESQLIHSTAGVLEHTIHREGTAHDDGLSGLLDTLGLVSGVLAVDRTDSSSGGGLKLDVTICQGRTSSAGGDGVIKHQSVQQKGAAAELVNDHLVDLISHADLGFSKSNSHV
nr:MAG TPA: hypothetical protein [Caudoviricetes sp.]